MPQVDSVESEHFVLVPCGIKQPEPPDLLTQEIALQHTNPNELLSGNAIDVVHPARAYHPLPITPKATITARAPLACVQRILTPAEGHDRCHLDSLSPGERMRHHSPCRVPYKIW